MNNPVLVTGSRGRIGKAIAMALRALGRDVIIHASSDLAGARKVSLEINGRDDLAWAFDLRDPMGAQEAFRKDVLERHGPCDLVLNASWFENESEPGLLDARSLVAMSAIHFESSLVLIAETARASKSCQAVAILDQNVENLHGTFLAYCVTKTALFASIPRLALAYAPYRVNAVAPGPTLPLPDADLDKFQGACRNTPLGRGVAVDDVVSAVLYLMSARAVTGQTLFVDSGQRLRQWIEPAA